MTVAVVGLLGSWSCGGSGWWFFSDDGSCGGVAMMDADVAALLAKGRPLGLEVISEDILFGRSSWGKYYLLGDQDVKLDVGRDKTLVL